MQARHIILIIVIVLLVILIWYNRDKWRNKYKVNGSSIGNVSNIGGAICSLYLEEYEIKELEQTDIIKVDIKKRMSTFLIQ